MQGSPRRAFLQSYPNQTMVFAGVETLTAIGRTSIGVDGAAEALGALAGTNARCNALAGVCNPTFMAGGERYVQSESLKSFDLSRGRFPTPGCRSRRSV